MKTTRIFLWMLVALIVIVGGIDFIGGDLPPLHDGGRVIRGLAWFLGAAIVGLIGHLVMNKLEELRWWNQLQKDGSPTTDYERLRRAVDQVMASGERIYFQDWQNAAQAMDSLLKEEAPNTTQAWQQVLWQAYHDDKTSKVSA